MTLFEYLHTIPTEPLHPISETNPPLRVFKRPLADPKEVGYDPYAIVEENPGTIVRALFHGQAVMSRLITVSLYQEPTAEGKTPNSAQLIRVFNKVCEAPKYVDEDVVSEHFIELQHQAEIAPAYNPKTNGLFAAVRFRLLYLRR